MERTNIATIIIDAFIGNTNVQRANLMDIINEVVTRSQEIEHRDRKKNAKDLWWEKGNFLKKEFLGIWKWQYCCRLFEIKCKEKSVGDGSLSCLL